MTTAADTATEPDHHQQRDPAREHQPGPRRLPAALLVAVAGDAPQWQDRALCAQTDPEAFFPEKGGSTWEAKQICTGCEVRAECLEDALGQDERFGIWGGLSERERRRLKRSGDLPAGEPRAVPEPRATPEQSRRESAPAPCGGRHAGGTGLATTLPTEPRHPHGRPVQASARSTFPDRARRADTEPAPAATAPSAPHTSSNRRSRASRSAPTTTRARTTTTAVTTAAPMATEAAVPAAGDAATIAGRGVGQPDLDPADDQAAAAPKAQARPPDLACASTPPAGGVLERVLAAHAGQPGADTVSIPVVAALATGGPVVEASRWETALAAVAAVESGQTRGTVARQLGEDSRDVAHWVRRHWEGMPMVDPRRDGTPEGTTRRALGGVR